MKKITLSLMILSTACATPLIGMNRQLVPSHGGNLGDFNLEGIQKLARTHQTDPVKLLQELRSLEDVVTNTNTELALQLPEATGFSDAKTLFASNPSLTTAGAVLDAAGPLAITVLTQQLKIKLEQVCRATGHDITVDLFPTASTDTGDDIVTLPGGQRYRLGAVGQQGRQINEQRRGDDGHIVKPLGEVLGKLPKPSLAIQLAQDALHKFSDILGDAADTILQQSTARIASSSTGQEAIEGQRSHQSMSVATRQWNDQVAIYDRSIQEFANVLQSRPANTEAALATACYGGSQICLDLADITVPALAQTTAHLLCTTSTIMDKAKTNPGLARRIQVIKQTPMGDPMGEQRNAQLRSLSNDLLTPSNQAAVAAAKQAFAKPLDRLVTAVIGTASALIAENPDRTLQQLALAAANHPRIAAPPAQQAGASSSSSSAV